MLEEVDRLTRMVDTLLTLSRADKGRATVRIEAVDIVALVREVVAQLEVLAEEKRQTLTVTAAPDLISTVDRLLLHSALINLIDKGGTIRKQSRPRHVAVTRSDDYSRYRRSWWAGVR